MKYINTLLVAFLVIGLSVVGTMGQTSAFTYQGKLDDGGSPANGLYDFTFTLFDLDTGGPPVAPAQIVEDVPVTNGIFKVELSFNFEPFTQIAANWIEVAVRPGAGTGGFVTLNPRQHITSAPYAMQTAFSVFSNFATTATNAQAVGGTPAAQIIKEGDLRLADARVPLPGSPSYIQRDPVSPQTGGFNIAGAGAVGGNLTVTGNMSVAGGMTGNAANLVNLNGANLQNSSVTRNKLASDAAAKYDPQLLAQGRWDLLPTGKTIAVGDAPTALASDGTFIYVANRNEGTVTRIRAATGVIEGSAITVGSGPVAMAYDGTFVYVANSLSNSVSRIRASTGLVEGSPIGVSTAPRALINAGTFIYVACGSGNAVSRIRASTGVVEGTIPLLGPWSFAFDGTWVYVTFDSDVATAIKKIDAATGELHPSTISMPGDPRQMAFDGTYVYTAASSAGQVRRFSVSTGTLDPTFFVSIAAPASLVFDGTFIYVASATGSTNPVNKIRASNGILEGNSVPVGGNPLAMLFAGNFIWVALQSDDLVKRF